MNSNLKIALVAGFVGLIAGISIATIDTATAQMLKPTSPDISRLSPKSFGAKTAGIVCGDRLCNEPQSVIDIEDSHTIGSISGEDSSAPHVQLISIDKYRQSTAQQSAITYKITFSVTAGEIDLRHIEFQVESDVDKTDFEISSLSSLKSSVNVVRIKAIDPDSITGEITGYSLTGPTSSDPNAPR